MGLLDTAITFYTRREKAQKHNTKCPFCLDEQVQLKDWTTDQHNLLYKCRSCKREFRLYDGFSNDGQ